MVKVMEENGYEVGGKRARIRVVKMVDGKKRTYETVRNSYTEEENKNRKKNKS